VVNKKLLENGLTLFTTSSIHLFSQSKPQQEKDGDKCCQAQ